MSNQGPGFHNQIEVAEIFETAESGPRIVIDGSQAAAGLVTIYFYSGDPNETSPAVIQQRSIAADPGTMLITSAVLSTHPTWFSSLTLPTGRDDPALIAGPAGVLLSREDAGGASPDLFWIGHGGTINHADGLVLELNDASHGFYVSTDPLNPPDEWVRAWPSFPVPPGLRNQGRANVNKTDTNLAVHKMGKRITAQARLDVTSASAGAGDITLDLPYPAAVAGVLIGTAVFYDASVGVGGTPTVGAAFSYPTDASRMMLIRDQSLAVAAVNTQLGIGDWFQIDVNYEAA